MSKPIINKEHIEYIIERSCLQKSNLSEEEANRIIDFHAKRGRVLYYYKCQFCNSFHLTKNIPLNSSQFKVELA